MVRIGDLPIDEALERVATVARHDNPQQVKWMSPLYLKYPEILEVTGVQKGLERVELTLDWDGKERRIAVDAIDYADDVFRNHGPRDIVINDAATAPLPMYLQKRDDHYWFEYLEKERLVYFQFNSVRNKEGGESIADFSTRLFNFVNQNAVGMRS